MYYKNDGFLHCLCSCQDLLNQNKQSSLYYLCQKSGIEKGHIVESLQSHCIQHSLTGPMGQPFASRHEGPGFNPQGGTYMKPGFYR
jgi:hypothetical protein